MSSAGGKGWRQVWRHARTVGQRTATRTSTFRHGSSHRRGNSSSLPPAAPQAGATSSLRRQQLRRAALECAIPAGTPRYRMTVTATEWLRVLTRPASMLAHWDGGLLGALSSPGSDDDT